MGNLFIGFPVPRAKIADMISTAAPPLLHAYTHEPGGDDEITLPSAGISTLYDDPGFHYKTFFPNLDGFEIDQAESGQVIHEPQNTILATGETTASWAKIVKNTNMQLPLLTFDKNIFLRFRFTFHVYSDINPGCYIITADATDHKHIGVSMYNSKLACSVHDGTTRAQVGIVSCPIEGEDYEFNVEIKFYAGSRVEYIIDGTLLHTQEDNIPSGAFYDESFLRLGVFNSNTTRDIIMGLSMLELYQPAT